MGRTQTPSTAPKVYELINWLVGPDQELPQRFLDHKSKLNSTVPYILEQLWTQPRLVKYLNEHTNNLFNIPDPLENLKLLKKIFSLNRITKYELWSFIPQRKPDLVKSIEEQDGYDENNARAKLLMINKMQGLEKSKERYIKKAPTKANIKKETTRENLEVIEKALQKTAKSKTSRSTSKFLPDITQELIDELGLIIFDVSLLKKSNRVLFTFIDSKNQKLYRTEPFNADIYLSTVDGVINNDYIEELTPDKFIHYNINNIQNFTRLKYMLNDSYKRILNGK